MITCDDAIVYSYKAFGDERGSLVPLECNGEIPFDVKRVFYIFDSDGDAMRGCHANEKSSFLLICVNGSVSVRLKDTTNSKDIELNAPTKGLYIPRMLWKEMYEFSDEAVLLVFSDEHFDPDEYIEDFDEYKAMLETGMY